MNVQLTRIDTPFSFQTQERIPHLAGKQNSTDADDAFFEEEEDDDLDGDLDFLDEDDDDEDFDDFGGEDDFY
jgi:hypothetical protein